MFSHYRLLAAARDFEDAQAYEDAAAFDCARGRASVADGVASAIFSNIWADLLARGTVEAPPPATDGEPFLEWLKERRREWRSRIDFRNLKHNQLLKLQECGGAFSTLLWAEVLPNGAARDAVDSEGGEPADLVEDAADSTSVECMAEGAAVGETPQEERTESTAQDDFGDADDLFWNPSQAEPFELDADAAVADSSADASLGVEAEGLRLRITAIGDCNLFLIRDGEVAATFPMAGADDFGLIPDSICSIPSKRDDWLVFRTFEGDCHPGDWLVLCTDAVAQHLLRRMEEGDRPDWRALWEVSEEDWLADLDRLRSERRIRRDDTTVLVLCVGNAPVA